MPSAAGSALSCVASASSASSLVRLALAATRAPGKKSTFLLARLSASSPEKNSKAWKLLRKPPNRDPPLHGFTTPHLLLEIPLPTLLLTVWRPVSFRLSSAVRAGGISSTFAPFQAHHFKVAMRPSLHNKTGMCCTGL